MGLVVLEAVVRYLERLEGGVVLRRTRDRVRFSSGSFFFSTRNRNRERARERERERDRVCLDKRRGFATKERDLNCL